MTEDSPGLIMLRQKRRDSPNKVLPVTTADVRGTQRIRRKGDAGNPKLWTIVIIVVLVAFVMFVGRSLVVGRSSTATFYEQAEQVRAMPLSQFPTVSDALKHANLVGLYFAASWCPMSTPITNLLGESFAPDLLYTGQESENQQLAIVHVSSDVTESDMQDYLKPGWIAVPFGSAEQDSLKRHFSVCAKRELEELGMDRKYEIPTLIILDGETHGVITTNGAHDLEEEGKQALDHWVELQGVIHGLSSKYAAETM